MNLEELKKYCEDKIESYPHLKEEIDDLYALAYAEVEQGGSQPHECELCIGSIDELIEKEK